MHPLNPLFSIIIFLIAFLTGYIINIKYKLKNSSYRNESIDGMRGFLALGVFIHHSSIWYQYIQNGNWEAPKSNLYNHLGNTSVAFFFMITSFLFVTKLLNSIEKEFNWKAFFVSRFYRLVPMYYVSLIIIIIYVFMLSHWQLKVSVMELLISILDWSIFTVRTDANINQVDLTSIINAGVVWSLPIEWLFYFSLPLISLILLKAKPKLVYIIISILFIAFYIYYRGLAVNHILSLVGGAIAPFILKYSSLSKKIQHPIFSFLVIICICLIGLFDNSDNLICKSLIILSFTLIAMGNNLFGLLENSTLKFLGEICYSTYLLHGIILFSFLYFGIGIEKMRTFNSVQYCLVIFTLTPIVVLLSFLGYKFIEKPCIDKARRINRMQVG